jgi:uncharacterized protein (TIGR02246 family)
MRKDSHLKLALCITAGLLIALPANKVGQAQTPSERRSPSSEDASGARPEDAAAIREVLSSYSAALNASDTNAVMPLYAEDGVFMPCYSPSCVGAKAIRKAYEDVFKAITLHVKFDVVEVVVMNPEWAFARTNSAGTQTDHATGQQSSEGNQELFIFHKKPGAAWKIARYSFSPTNPPSSRKE